MSRSRHGLSPLPAVAAATSTVGAAAPDASLPSPADEPEAMAPATVDARAEKRRAQRFDKVFPVWVESDAFGECQGIARNISSGGMFIEMSEPLPLGCAVRIHFTVPDSDGELVARGEVKRHYFLHYTDAEGPRALTGMGVRFTLFELDGASRLGRTLSRYRTLH